MPNRASSMLPQPARPALAVPIRRLRARNRVVAALFHFIDQSPLRQTKIRRPTRQPAGPCLAGGAVAAVLTTRRDGDKGKDLRPSGNFAYGAGTWRLMGDRFRGSRGTRRALAEASRAGLLLRHGLTNFPGPRRMHR